MLAEDQQAQQAASGYNPLHGLGLQRNSEHTAQTVVD